VDEEPNESVVVAAAVGALLSKSLVDVGDV
jgi:ElaB/YqjD/DUF883 family membrane-anchored ribosome-binding protein